jgi:hypothetical protein
MEQYTCFPPFTIMWHSQRKREIQRKKIMLVTVISWRLDNEKLWTAGYIANVLLRAVLPANLLFDYITLILFGETIKSVITQFSSASCQFTSPLFLIFHAFPSVPLVTPWLMGSVDGLPLRGPGSIPDNFIWDLLWTKWCWDRFFSEYFRSTPPVSCLVTPHSSVITHPQSVILRRETKIVFYDFLTLKMNAMRYFETSVIINVATQRNNSKDRIFDISALKTSVNVILDLKSCVVACGAVESRREMEQLISRFLRLSDTCDSSTINGRAL